MTRPITRRSSRALSSVAGNTPRQRAGGVGGSPGPVARQCSDQARLTALTGHAAERDLRRVQAAAGRPPLDDAGAKEFCAVRRHLHTA